MMRSKVYDIPLGKTKSVRAFSIAWWAIVAAAVAAGYLWCLGMCAALMCL